MSRRGSGGRRPRARRERLAREHLPASRVLLVRKFDREASLQSGRQFRVAGLQFGQGLLEHRHSGVVGRDYRDRRSSQAEDGAREQRAVVETTRLRKSSLEVQLGVVGSIGGLESLSQRDAEATPYRRRRA